MTTKSALLAGWDPARTAAWRDELAGCGAWTLLQPVHSFAAARVLLHRHQPDLLVSDLRLPDGNLIDIIRILRTGLGGGPGHPASATQVLVIAQGQDALLLDALQEGADNFFDLDQPAGATLASHALDTLAGGADIAPWIARRLLDHFRLDGPGSGQSPIEELANPLALTMAERQLLRQLALGQRLGEVARKVGLGPRELAAGVRAIYRKMQWSLRAGDLSLQIA